MTKYPIYLERESELVKELIQKYNKSCTVNEIGTNWACIDDAGKSFYITCFNSSPDTVSVYPVAEDTVNNNL